MLTTLLIGVALGAAWALGVIFTICVVETKEKRHEHSQVTTALCNRAFALVAENAQLRLSLAAGEMTEDGKKVAAMTMAALGTVTTANSDVILTRSPNPVKEPA